MKKMIELQTMRRIGSNNNNVLKLDDAIKEITKKHSLKFNDC